MRKNWTFSIVLVAVLLLAAVGAASGQVSRIIDMFERQQMPGEIVEIFALNDGGSAYLDISSGDSGPFLRLTMLYLPEEETAYLHFVKSQPPDILKISACGHMIHAVANWTYDNTVQYFQWEIEPQIMSCQEFTAYFPQVIRNEETAHK